MRGFLDRWAIKRAEAVLGDEKRASSGAISSFKNPRDWFIHAIGGSSTSGTNVNDASVMGISTAYACVRILAESIASLPIKVYRETNNGNERVKDHPLTAILKSEPNDVQTAFEWKEMMQGTVGLRGNAYTFIERDASYRPTRLIPILNSDIDPLKTDQGYGIRYKINGMVYEAYDVIHLRSLMTNGYIGLSPIAVLRNTFGMAIAGQEHGARTFKNGAMIPGIIEMPTGIDPEKVDKMRSEWDKHHAGVQNSGRPAILYGGMSWKDVGFNNKDAQFLESRKFDVEEIARAYRIPLHLLQHTEKSTSWGSGIEEQNIAFVEYTLRPWIERWEETLGRVLLTQQEKREGFFLRFNIDALLRGDFKTRMEGYKTAIESGIWSINEVRRKEDEPSIDPEIGDVHYRPLNTAPAQQLETVNNE